MLIPQNMPLFLDLGATEQTVVFSRLLHLDLWDDAIKTAKTQASLLQDEVTTAQHEVDTLTSRLEEVEVSVVTYQQKTDSWAKEQHREAAHQQGQVNAATIAVNAAKTALTTAATAAQQIAKQYAAAEKDRTLLVTNEEQARQVVEAAKVGCGVAAERLRAATERQQSLSTLKARCPVCAQPIRPSHLTNEKTAAVHAIATAKSFHAQALNNRKNAEHALAQASTKLHNVTLDVQQLAKELGAAQQLEIRYMSDLRRAEHDLTQARKAAQEHAETVNPYQTLVAETEARKTKLSDQKQAAAQALADAEARYMRTQFWVGGFKQVRTALLEHACHLFSVEMTHWLGMHGMPQWAAVLTVESETQKGTVKKGLSLSIVAPGRNAGRTAAKIQWESWSGGEAQRLRLAATMAIQSLIEMQTAVHPNVEIYDEPGSVP